MTSHHLKCLTERFHLCHTVKQQATVNVKIRQQIARRTECPADPRQSHEPFGVCLWPFQTVCLNLIGERSKDCYCGPGCTIIPVSVRICGQTQSHTGGAAIQVMTNQARAPLQVVLRTDERSDPGTGMVGAGIGDLGAHQSGDQQMHIRHRRFPVTVINPGGCQRCTRLFGTRWERGCERQTNQINLSLNLINTQ